MLASSHEELESATSAVRELLPLLAVRAACRSCEVAWWGVSVDFRSDPLWLHQTGSFLNHMDGPLWLWGCNPLET